MAGKTTNVYSSADVEIFWNGKDLSYGWGEDSFLSVTPINPRRTVKFGADGRAAVSKMAAKGATITLTVQGSSPVNNELREAAALQDVIGEEVQVAPFKIKDPSGTILGATANAILTEIPTIELGNEATEVTWTWIAELWITDNDPESITSAINSYLPT